jgi:uncharacterized protein (DUF924 family)
MAASPKDVVGYWLHAGPEKWFKKSDAFDDALRLRFEATHHAAARGEYDAWLESAEGALALILLLDQIPRNIYRGSAHAFATDAKARQAARIAVERGFDKAVDPDLQPFLYLPFEHSEDAGDQARSVELCAARAAATGDEGTLKWAKLHKDIIDRFGRFPHRNACFGRATTPEEQAFLDEGGFSG